jgi:ankyrin repeat protein
MSNTFWSSLSEILFELFDVFNDDNNVSISFLNAVRTGNLALVNLTLELDLIDPSFENNIAIREASEHGHVNIVDRLLRDTKKRVDPSVNDNYAISISSRNGHVAVVDRLLQELQGLQRLQRPLTSGFNYPIFYACYNGHVAVVDRLLQVDNMNISSIVAWENTKKNTEVVDRLLQEKTANPVSFCYWAVRNGNIDIVELLLQDNRVSLTMLKDEADQIIYINVNTDAINANKVLQYITSRV